MDWLIPVLFVICLLTGAFASLAGVWLGCWVSWRWGKREKFLPTTSDDMPVSVADNEEEDDDNEEFIEDDDSLEKATM